MKADRKARKEVHGFRRAYQCTYVCDRCLACKTSAKKSVQELNFANMSRTAPWRATQFSHEDYVAQERVCSPFVQVPGFRLETAWSDMMHDMYLGVAGDAIANSLVEIWEYGLLRSNNGEPYAEPSAAFKHVQLDMQMWFRQRGLSPPPHQFNLAVLGRNSYQNPPELSSKFKAAQVKQLVMRAALHSSNMNFCLANFCLSWPPHHACDYRTLSDERMVVRSNSERPDATKMALGSKGA